MKRCIMMMALALVAIGAYAQKPATVKGRILDDRTVEVKLCSIRGGETLPIASTKIEGENRDFEFTFTPEYSGFYTVNNDYGMEEVYHTIYVKPGDNVNLEIDLKRASLVGKNTKENTALYVWEDASHDVRRKSVFYTGEGSTYEDFFPDLEKLLARKDAIKGSVNTKNKEFDKELKTKIDHDMDWFTAYYIQTAKSKHPGKDDLPEYYDTLVTKNPFTTNEVLKYPYGARFIYSFPRLPMMVNAIKGGPRDPDMMNPNKGLEMMSDPEVKGYAVLMNGEGTTRSHDDYLDFVEKNSEYMITPDLKAKMEELGKKFPAVVVERVKDFPFYDVDGNVHKFSDYLGKVIYVDVWATWCGPCRQQIPHMKALEEEMHGRDVVFMSVSTDAEKDKAKWAKMIEDEEMGGVQVWAGFSEFSTEYEIKTIPRFMVIDKEGNLVQPTAPAPSNAARIKAVLEKHLK